MKTYEWSIKDRFNNRGKEALLSRSKLVHHNDMDDPRRRITGDERVIEALRRNDPVTAIIHDPDIHGATVGQVSLLAGGVPWITPDIMDQIYVIASSVAHKLGAMRYHCKNFERVQTTKLQELATDPVKMASMVRGVLHCERDLLYEFEGFHLQLKSCLDLLVKLLGPVLHIQPDALRTYGDAGQKIIKTLERKKDHKKLIEAGKLIPHRIDGLIELILEARKNGLEEVIDLRDMISHYSVFSRFGFSCQPGIIAEIAPPTIEIAEQQYPALTVMNNIMKGMLSFVPEFIGRTFTCAIPRDPAIRALDELEKRYIGALWDMDLSLAIWGQSSDVLRTFTEEDIEKARASQRRRIIKPGEL